MQILSKVFPQSAAQGSVKEAETHGADTAPAGVLRAGKTRVILAVSVCSEPQGAWASGRFSVSPVPLPGRRGKSVVE